MVLHKNRDLRAFTLVSILIKMEETKAKTILAHHLRYQSKKQHELSKKTFMMSKTTLRVVNKTEA